MLKCNKMKDVNFLDDPHYKLYLKGKAQSHWDECLDWSMAQNDLISEELKTYAIDIASMSAHVEILGMQNAAELLSECEDFALKIALGQAVNDEARHAELFAKYAILSNGEVRDCSKTQELYDEHFEKLQSFDETFLSHVFLENGALEQFNVFITTFGEQSLIGQIYKGALQDEARHVQLGIQYFKNKVSINPNYVDFIRAHLNDYRSILHMNEAAVLWYSKLSGMSVCEIKNRVEDRHNSFTNKILKGI